MVSRGLIAVSLAALVCVGSACGDSAADDDSSTPIADSGAAVDPCAQVWLEDKQRCVVPTECWRGCGSSLDKALELHRDCGPSVTMTIRRCDDYVELDTPVTYLGGGTCIFDAHTGALAYANAYQPEGAPYCSDQTENGSHHLSTTPGRVGCSTGEALPCNAFFAGVANGGFNDADGSVSELDAGQ